MSFTPTCAGIGLRFDHYEEVRTAKPDVGFLEVHSENFFGGGYHRDTLLELAQTYPISLHGVGLSLGASEPVDNEHVQSLKQLVDDIQPVLVSDHASWSRTGNAHLGDLLPLPYTEETLQALCDNVARVQDALGRSILIENPSTYLQFSDLTMSEAEYLVKACERTQCRLLLDVNNLYVQQHNHGVNAMQVVHDIPKEWVGEIHLAGHIEQAVNDDQSLLIDTHSQPVPDAVWAIYETAIAHCGAVPSLIEWDKDIPELNILLDEAEKANAILQSHNSRAQYGVG